MGGWGLLDQVSVNMGGCGLEVYKMMPQFMIFIKRIIKIQRTQDMTQDRTNARALHRTIIINYRTENRTEDTK